MQTLLRCLYSPHVQSHTSVSVRTLKIPNTGSHLIYTIISHASVSVRTLKIPNTGSHLIYTIIWTRENIAYTDRNGYSAALAKRLSLFQLTVKMTPQLWLILQTPLHLLRISRNVTTSLSQWSQYHILQIDALAERQTESGKQKQSTLCRQQRRRVHIWLHKFNIYLQ